MPWASNRVHCVLIVSLTAMWLLRYTKLDKRDSVRQQFNLSIRKCMRWILSQSVNEITFIWMRKPYLSLGFPFNAQNQYRAGRDTLCASRRVKILSEGRRIITSLWSIFNIRLFLFSPLGWMESYVGSLLDNAEPCIIIQRESINVQC